MLGAVVAVVFVIALIVGVTVAVTSSRSPDRSADDRWTAQMEANFMNACAATGGARAISSCRCALDAIQAKYSASEFIDFEAATNATGVVPWVVQSTVRHCYP